MGPLTAGYLPQYTSTLSLAPGTCPPAVQIHYHLSSGTQAQEVSVFQESASNNIAEGGPTLEDSTTQATTFLGGVSTQQYLRTLPHIGLTSFSLASWPLLKIVAQPPTRTWASIPFCFCC